MNETTAIKTKRVLINICKYALLIFAAFVALVAGALLGGIG